MPTLSPMRRAALRAARARAVRRVQRLRDAGHPASALDRNHAIAGLDLAALAPRDVAHLQRHAGNRACAQLLAGPAKVQRTEVGNQFYAHGAFMGAARRMMVDPLWSRILQVLMPDVHAQATIAMRPPFSAGHVIPMLENNPVMAAYGLFKTQEMDQRREGGRSDRMANMQAMEWDVWLDPRTIGGYRVAFDHSTERALDARLVETMLIAHGTTRQTVLENQVGWQYEAVRGTAKADLGGARGPAWMDLFGRALRLATSSDVDADLARMSGEARHTDRDDQSTFNTFRSQMGFTEVVDLYRRTFGKDRFSVLLDVKSRNAEPWVLRRLILELNRRGVHVHSVGTFTFTELRNLDQIDQNVAGQRMGAPVGIKFFHGIGNLQTACIDREVFRGDHVMFNAGSILDSVDWDADRPDADDDAIAGIIAGLRELKERYGFRLGLYVQEGSTDHRAARKITEFSNRHRDVFDMGFGWGGLSDDMGHVSDGGSGMGAQEWIPWNEWDADERPGVPPSTGFEAPFSIKRGLESRRFEVRRGHVSLETSATWDREPGPSRTYFVRLRQDEWGRDSAYTRYRNEVGSVGTARWDNLENGKYYLEIEVEGDERATLNGRVKIGH